MSNMVVNTNVLALNSHRNLKNVGRMNEKASQRLSSGLRINSAADDAAGLAISEKMRAQIRGLDMASKNTQDATSLIQTAEGGMQEIDNMLQRIRELTVQASNDTNENNTAGTGDRQKIQDEIDSLVGEIDSMAERTEFNKKKVINGDYSDPQQAFDTASANYDRALAARGDGTTDGTLKSANDALAKYEGKQDGTTIGTKGELESYQDAAKIINGAKSALESAEKDFGSKFEAVDTLINDINKKFGIEIELKADDLKGMNTTDAKDAIAKAIADAASKNATLDVATDGGANSQLSGITDYAGLSTWASDVAAADSQEMQDFASALDFTAIDDLAASTDKVTTAQKGLDDLFTSGSGTEIKVATADTDGTTPAKEFSSLEDFEKSMKESTDKNNIALNSYNDAKRKDDEVYNNLTKYQNDMDRATADKEALGGKEAGLYFQVGANANQGIKVSIGSIKSDVLGIGDGSGKASIDVVKDSGKDITSTLNVLDEALSYVTTERSRLGATQNRLEYTQKSLDISSENLSSAESRIRDADMAKEMMNKTQANVLQQAATSMLAQANQAPQNVLQLIG